MRLCLKRLHYFLLFDETNPKASHWLYRVTTVVWLVLAVVGALVSSPQRRRLWPTYAVFLAVMLFHTLVIVSARFRIPVEPLSLIWAAAAVAPLVARAEALAMGGWHAVATRGAGSRQVVHAAAFVAPEGLPGNALPGPHFLTDRRLPACGVEIPPPAGLLFGNTGRGRGSAVEFFSGRNILLSLALWQTRLAVRGDRYRFARWQESHNVGRESAVALCTLGNWWN